MAKVDGNTQVTLNSGTVEKDVFGGGEGTLKADNTPNMSADVSGTASVTANGTTFTFPTNGIDETVNHNIYGGGNLACVVNASNVTIYKGILEAGFLDGDESSSWGKFIGDVNAQADNVMQGSVFGGGYGVNTTVTTTVTVNVKITDDDATNKAMVGVIGGGYNGYVLGNTDVTVAGVSEIYKVYGGGLGSYDGYANAPTDKRSGEAIKTFKMNETVGSVGESKDGDGTSVTIKGGKIYDNIFGGGAGLKYKETKSYLNVAEVFGKSNVVVDAIGGWKDDASAYAHKIYGGGALGLVSDKITVDVKSGTMAGAEIFAGSLGELDHLDKAKVTAGASIKTSTNASEPAGTLQGYFNMYGGCDMAQMEGDTDVEIKHGTFSGSIFGAGKGLPSVGEEEYLDYGKVTGKTKVVVDAPSVVLGQEDGLKDDGTIADAKKVIKVYGGGALGLVDGKINPVTLKSGTLYGEVFGGSLGELGHPDKAKITLPENETLGVLTAANSSEPAGALQGNINIYGGCDMALVDGNTKVEIKHGTFTGQMFGGGKGVASNIVDGVDTYAEHGKVKGETTIIYNNDGTFNGNVYGGGALGAVIPASAPADGYTTEIYLKKGVLNGHVFGGGYGESTNKDKAKVTGNTYITTRIMDDPADVLSGSMNHIYGGGDMAMVDGDTNIDFTRGSFNGEIFGGGHGIEEASDTEKGAEKYLDFGKVIGTTNVTIDGGTLGTNNDNENEKIRIYGGGALGLVGTGINIVIKSGEHYGEIFGGSLGEEGHPKKAVISGDSYLHTEANANKDPLSGNIKFYGGCNLSQVTGNSSVLINHGTFGGAVFGGGKGVSGSKEYGNIGGNTSVLIKDGDTRADVYGGGALGNVSGKTDVDLAGGAVKDVYGGGLGDASTEAIVYGDALVTLNGSTVDGVANDCKVYGSIFGCNNVNGTPKGHAKVHVLKTVMRDGQDTSPENQNVSDAVPSYHVAGVYGGGNHAAYQPTSDDDFAEVLIENCDNSIAYVYGGGNAAPVPATKVTIYGANAIDHAFAGGNGAGAGNPGADVGYLDYHSKGSNETYGSGNAEISVLGGTVHNIYGGSNTLGYIRTGTSVSVKQEGDCPLVVGNVFGGGNEADIDGNITINLDCDKGSDLLYAGANNADVNGSITLNIYSGTFGKVFCGNNTGGAVRGKLTVNVDETGCWPVMIGELYGGGNKAGYSVYGYEVDDEGKTLRDDDGNVVVKTEGERLYEDPEVNLCSFTRIGKVFGGGYGETAVLYGNTHVNVEPISGIYADGTAKPDFVLDSTDEAKRVPNTQTVLEVLGADKIGSIGSIYGGGNAGAVYGDTYVTIGSKIKNHHISGDDKTTEEEVGVTITGDVFGGGNEAIVSGNTNVTIGAEED